MTHEHPPRHEVLGVAARSNWEPVGMSRSQSGAVATSSHPLGWFAWVVAAGLFAAGETLAVLNRTRGDLPWSDSRWMFVLLAFGFATVGALVLSRHPRHAIGWLLYVVGLCFEISFAAQEYGVYTLETAGQLFRDDDAVVAALPRGAADLPPAE